MKKLRFLVALLWWIPAAATQAQTLVVDAATELTDGTVVSLQCRDTNGGAGWYFNGAAQKSSVLGKANLYRVVGSAAGGLKLCRLADNQYLTRSGDAIGMSASADGAVTMTAVSYGSDEAPGFVFDSNAMDTQMEGTEKGRFVRFTNNGSHLNMQAKAATPKFAGGRGGYSAWYVYTYTQAEVDDIMGQINAEVHHVCGGTTFAVTQTEPVSVGSSYTVSSFVTNRPGLTPVAGQNLTFTIRKDTPLVVEYAYDAAALPFETGRDYYLFVKRNPLKGVRYDSSDQKCRNTGVGGATQLDEAARFYFEGDNVTGFTLMNRAAGEGLSLGGTCANNDNLTFVEKGGNTVRFVVERNGESGYALRDTRDALGYVNDINGTLGHWIDNRAPADAGSTFEIAAPDDTYFYTCRYYYEDESRPYGTPTDELLTTTGEPVIPACDYKYYVYQRHEVADAAGPGRKTVKAFLTQGNLPFEPSASFDEAHWYAMDVHANEKNYTPYYGGEGHVRVTTTAVAEYQEGEAPASFQWCFVGNAWDGFRIYNKSAGAGVSLYQPADGDVEVSMAAEGNAFRLSPTGATQNPLRGSEAVCFSVEGRSYYLNHRGNRIQGWTSRDEGSSFRCFEVTRTNTLAGQVTALLKEIGGRFPAEEPGMDFPATWPQEYADGGYDRFGFLDEAREAVENNRIEALVGFKTQLTHFTQLSGIYGYPRSIIFKYPSAAYGTVYLPFNTACPDGLKLYECNAVEANGTTLELTDSDAGIKANKAYLIALEDAAVAGKCRQIISYTEQQSNEQANPSSLLRGTHSDFTAPAGSYVLQQQQGVLGFYRVDGSRRITVPAGRCYLQLPAGQAAGTLRLVFPDGSTTGLGALDAEAGAADGPAYDLSGRRIATPQRGLYIVGGRKVLVR